MEAGGVTTIASGDAKEEEKGLTRCKTDKLKVC